MSDQMEAANEATGIQMFILLLQLPSTHSIVRWVTTPVGKPLILRRFVHVPGIDVGVLDRVRLQHIATRFRHQHEAVYKLITCKFTFSIQSDASS